MNRKIKFRIWDNGRKEWLHGPNNEINLLGETIIFGEILRRSDDTAVSLDDLNDLVALQYTGLKDKNDRDIYEGDIVQFKRYDVYQRWWSSITEIPVIEKECESQRNKVQIDKHEVEYRDGGFCLGYSLTLEDVARGEKFVTGRTHYCDTESKWWDFEVIGNIYQNPDLLKS